MTEPTLDWRRGSAPDVAAGLGARRAEPLPLTSIVRPMGRAAHCLRSLEARRCARCCRPPSPGRRRRRRRRQRRHRRPAPPRRTQSPARCWATASRSGRCCSSGLRPGPAREVGLFRYGLIQDALEPALSTKQRGRLVRVVATRTHPGPFGTPVQISRASLDGWIRDYRAGGFAALVPAPSRVLAGTPAHVLDLAVALKTEAPDRTAAQVAVVLASRGGFAPSSAASVASPGSIPQALSRRRWTTSRPRNTNVAELSSWPSTEPICSLPTSSKSCGC